MYTAVVKDQPPLKLCPFCGSKANLCQRKTTWVECIGCGALMFGVKDGEQRSAVRLWNRRK